MDYVANYLLALCIGTLLTLLLTPAVRWAAQRIGMVDQPDKRRINTTPIPRGGGVAVFISFHLALWIVGSFSSADFLGRLGPHWQHFFLIASSLLLFIGLLDDLLGLRPWLKLAGQIMVAMLLFGGGARVGSLMWFQTPEPLDFLLTIAWFVIIINAFNLIDGMDGLAAGLALIGSLGLAACLFTRGLVREALPLVALVGACIGFLRFNFNPATIFLGDSGSMFLGLVVATIPLYTASKYEMLASLGVPLLVMGVPLFDTVLAIWRRSVRSAMPTVAGHGGRMARLMVPDREHLHHRLLSRGLTQRAAALALYALSALMVTVAVASLLFKSRATGIVMLGFVIVAYLMVRQFSRVELWDTGQALLTRAQLPLSTRLTVPLYIIFDGCMLVAAWVISRRLALLPLSSRDLAVRAPLFFVPIVALLAIARTYQRTWGRARMRDFVLLFASTSIGCAIGYALVILFGLREPGMRRQLIIFATLLPLPLIYMRLARELLKEGVATLERKRLQESSDAERVLAFGGGRRFSLLQRNIVLHVGEQRRVIVGVIDDDIIYNGRILEGYAVLGRTEDLARLIAELKVSGILITAVINEAKRAELSAIAREAGIWLKEWKLREELLLEAREPKSRFDKKGDQL